MKKANDLATQYADLSKELQGKLANVDVQAATALAGATGDRARFEQLLKDQVKLTESEIAQLSGMSTDDIMALIIAAGGATFAGGALGKTGKSRGQVDIERLREQIEEMKESATT